MRLQREDYEGNRRAVLREAARKVAESGDCRTTREGPFDRIVLCSFRNFYCSSRKGSEIANFHTRQIAGPSDKQPHGWVRRAGSLQALSLRARIMLKTTDREYDMVEGVLGKTVEWLASDTMHWTAAEECGDGEADLTGILHEAASYLNEVERWVGAFTDKHRSDAAAIVARAFLSKLRTTVKIFRIHMTIGCLDGVNGMDMGRSSNPR